MLVVRNDVLSNESVHSCGAIHMGIDIQALYFLAYAKKQGVDFSSTLTLGRQALHVNALQLVDFAKNANKPEMLSPSSLLGDGYCEKLLTRVFGAQHVESVDASNYENATFIADLNEPVTFPRSYSAVLDLGVSEHIFDVANTMDNIMRACAVGGHIIHFLPANNFCGHGFYQFSPEFFFSLYTQERGFMPPQVFLVEHERPLKWFRVESTIALRKRVNAINSWPLSVLVLTRRNSETIQSIEQLVPQQSDYALVEWQSSLDEQPKRQDFKHRVQMHFTALARRFPRVYGLYALYRFFYHKRSRLLCNLHHKRSDIAVLDVPSLVSDF